MNARHPFTKPELDSLIVDAGLLANDEPKAKDEFVRRINALRKLREGLMSAEGSLMADLFRGPYPDTASESGVVEHAAQ